MTKDEIEESRKEIFEHTKFGNLTEFEFAVIRCLNLIIRILAEKLGD